ncbi:MAG: cellulase family glycosylhydrolase [Planctomycetes bacterium]|nr:cellulase family glycosylhydrolase [Planctomycetota bacterium]
MMSRQVIKRLLIILLVLLLSSKSLPSDKKIEFWNTQRKGANGDGGKDPEKWFAAAALAGIEFVRLIPVNWQSEGRDFLLGDADNFTGIPSQDLRKLKDMLDVANRHNVKVLLTMFSLPGARNRQDNDYKFDYRLWTDKKYQQQALAFWKELAAQLKNHPAIVGYNPLNEPHPARRDGFESSREDFADWLNRHKGGTSDLNRFNRLIVKAIRSQDKETPIILDCWFHSSADGFLHLTPVDDDALLYAFHFYEPWIFATYRINKGRFSYPDTMPGETPETTAKWTISEIHRRLQPVVEWAQRYNIPTSRIIAEELGCDRRVSGAKEYLEDIVRVFNDARWHWAFYSFRSSDWDGLDYELGTEKLGWKYWQQREKGIDHEELIKRRDNPIWDVFKREFTQKQKTNRSVEDITNPDVRKLVQTLSSSDHWRQRQEAAMAIGQMGIEAKDAIPSLIERLEDEQWHVRKAAAIALTSMGAEAKPAVNSLITALDDEEWHVRKPAAQALAAIGRASRPAVPALIKALDDEEWHVRKPAAEALAAIGPASKPAISQLIYALNDEEWHVRKPAAMALGAIGPDAKKAIPVLKEMLNDPEWHVQEAAKDALEKISRQSSTLGNER